MPKNKIMFKIDAAIERLKIEYTESKTHKPQIAPCQISTSSPAYIAA